MRDRGLNIDLSLAQYGCQRVFFNKYISHEMFWAKHQLRSLTKWRPQMADDIPILAPWAAICEAY